MKTPRSIPGALVALLTIFSYLARSVAWSTNSFQSCPLSYIPGSSPLFRTPDKMLGIEVWTKDGNVHNEITTVKVWFLFEDSNLEIPVVMGEPTPTGHATVESDLWDDGAQLGCLELGHAVDGSLLSLAYCVQREGKGSPCEETVGPVGNIENVDKLKLTCPGHNKKPTEESVQKTIQGKCSP